MILWIATFGVIGGMTLVLGGVLAVAGRQTRLEEEEFAGPQRAESSRRTA